MGLSCSQTKSKSKQKLTESEKFENQNSIKKSNSNKFCVNDENNEKKEKKSKSKNKNDFSKKKNIRKLKSLGEKENQTIKSSMGTENIINSTKNLDKYNQKEKKEEKKITKNKLKRSNIMRSYLPKLNIENIYYIVCPTCQLLFPDIKEINYDKEKKDFNVSYTCKCNNSGNLNKSMFLNFINGNRPHERNNEFDQSEILEPFIKEMNKKKNFEGKEMLTSAIQNSLDINSAAPPAFSNIKESISILFLNEIIYMYSNINGK